MKNCRMRIVAKPPKIVGSTIPTNSWRVHLPDDKEGYLDDRQRDEHRGCDAQEHELGTRKRNLASA